MLVPCYSPDRIEGALSPPRGRIRRYMLTLILLLLSAAALSDNSGMDTLKLTDYLDLEKVSDPEISPDGKSAIYTRTRVNTSTDQFDHEVWIMRSNGSHNRKLMDSGREVTWSPSGDLIAFIDDSDTGPEIFVRKLNDESPITQLTHGGRFPRNISWSPDGSWVSYIGSSPASENIWDIQMPAPPEGATWTTPPDVIDKIHYQLDGQGLLPDTHSHLFVVSLNHRVSKQLTSGDWSVGTYMAGMDLSGIPQWTPDGGSIIYSANTSTEADSEFLRSNLFSIDVESLNSFQLTHGTGAWGILTGVKVSRNGKKIAYIGTSDATASNNPPIQLRISDVNGENSRILLKDLPDVPSFLEWANDGRGVYFVAGSEGYTRLHYVSILGEKRVMDFGKRSVSISSASDDGVGYGTISGPYSPGEVASFKIVDGSDLQTLTEANIDVLGGKELGRVEEILYQSTGDTKVQGWIIYPPGFDPKKKYPLILDIHGGPEAMSEGTFDFQLQEMAANGYIVLYTNPRGSTGYGSAFSSEIYDSYPGQKDFDDLMAGVDFVIHRGFVDERKIYVQGCSGGGTLTAWTLTKTDRFAGAAALCPIVNMISFAGTTDLTGWIFAHFKKPFWEDPKSWIATSSIMHIGNVTTPTLVMVGKNDLRTPVGQSEELYKALKLLGIPTKLILFNDERHATIRTPSNMLRTQLYLRKWYEQWRRE